jgi:tRNA threonylcarbamoyladenosine modification (KEOPS) complex  Pcc1 subunit
MVKSPPFALTITINPKTSQNKTVIWSALEPELLSIDSKRVKLHSKSNKTEIVFHLTASDVNALRAAATSLMRLYLVADGVHQMMVKKNG